MPTDLRRKISKSQVLTEIKNIVFVLLGCLLLAFADAAFLTPCNIVSGGVASVGIIVNYFVEPSIGVDITDFVIDGVQVVLWVVGLCTLGKKFSLNTLVASLAYPLFYTILYRFMHIGNLLGIEGRALYPDPQICKRLNF
jgi:uncharacterized membrane-anchored protein YitT (DUF2179 family)